MALWDTGGSQSGRRPSLTGVVMQYVRNGQETVAAWPRKRGTNLPQSTKDRNIWFRKIQWAWKYLVPDMQTNIMNARKGTPLLPRDIWTMMAAGTFVWFVRPNGRKIFPMQAMQAVSLSLDTLSQVPGSMIIRGPQFWEAVPYVPPNVPLVTFDSGELTSDAASIIWENIPANAEDIILSLSVRQNTTNTSTYIQYNGDDGNNYWWRRWNRFGGDAQGGVHRAECSENANSDSADGSYNIVEIIIKSYASTNRFKMATATTGNEINDNLDLFLPVMHNFQWRSLDAIDRVELIAGGGGFAAGTRWTVYLRNQSVTA